MKRKQIKRLLAVTLCGALMIPAPVSAAELSVRSIHTGDGESYVVMNDNSLWKWGEGRAYCSIYYKQGDPVQNRPAKIRSNIRAAGEDWWITTSGDYYYGDKKYLSNAVQAEKFHILQADGTLWYWDIGDMIKVTTGVKDFSVSSGQDVAIIKADGSLWLKGYDVAHVSPKLDTFDTFYKVADHVADVKYGYQNLFVLKKDGTLWGWGSNYDGQIGNGSRSKVAVFEQKIMEDVAAIDTAFGYSVFAIKKDGSLWAWGDANHGSLGVGTKYLTYSDWDKTYMGNIARPQKVMDDVAAVSKSSSHALILKEDGTVWVCGSNKSLEIGNGFLPALDPWGSNEGDQFTPIQVSFGKKLGGYEAPKTAFLDVASGSYYEKPIQWAVEENITSGTSATTFSPDMACTRAQIMTFLWRAAGSPAPKGGSPFRDVYPPDYYNKATAWAYEQGMVKGDSFAPNAICTRAMAVEFMWKYAGSPDAAGAAFRDVKKNDSYSEAVGWAVEKHITSGTGDGVFSPGMGCTRGQIMTFLYRFLGE